MQIDKSKLYFRKAEIKDIETLINYRIQFITEWQGNPTAEIEKTLRTTLNQYFTKALANDTFVAWIAEFENKAIGFSGMVIREQPGTFDMPYGKTGYILNMFTVKDFRGNGIGSVLFDKLMDEARQRKIDKVELYATKNGEPIYRKAGFYDPHEVALEWKVK